MTALFFLDNITGATLRMMTPLLLVALGELYSERAGLTNIGLDGIMSIGTIAGFLGGCLTGSPWMGLLLGALCGVALNMIYAFCTITLRAGQIINGMALNILGPALVTYLYRRYFGVTDTLISVNLMQNIHIPWLSDIPILGALFSATPMTYLSLLLLLGTWFFFYKTRPGINFMAVGEYPRAAETMGIHVNRVKYLASVICGALAGLGGAFLTTCYMSTFTEGMVTGRGFYRSVRRHLWRLDALGVFLATLLFGFVDALQLRLQVRLQLPYQLLAYAAVSLHLCRPRLYAAKEQRPQGQRPALRPGGAADPVPSGVRIPYHIKPYGGDHYEKNRITFCSPSCSPSAYLPAAETMPPPAPPLPAAQRGKSPTDQRLDQRRRLEPSLLRRHGRSRQAVQF